MCVDFSSAATLGNIDVFKKTSISVVVHILLQTFIGYYGNIDTEVPSRTIINTNINICSLEKY